jgi:sulfur carrier protein
MHGNGASASSSIIRPVIHVTVNGKAHQFQQPLELSALLSGLDLAGKKIAVERNGEIVPRSAHACTLVGDGDRLEIVVAVGGG